MELRTYQREAIDAVYEYLREHDDNPCVVLPTGCHAAGHPILMWDGTVKPVEDVVVGDLVMGPDSEPRQVLELCRGEDDLFRITPFRGESFVVNGDHMLSLVCTNEGKGKYPSHRQGGEIDNVTVREYLEKSKSWRHLRKLYRVSVNFSGNPCLPIPPYILGLLLGDGSLESETTSLTTADEAIARVWMEYAAAVGCEVHVRDHGGRCPTYRLRRASGKYNFVTEALNGLGLAGTKSGTKFIPQQYQLSSRADRLQLIAGLIDSDGSATKSGIDYVTQSLELAGDIIFLARSLGFWAKATRKYCTCQTGSGGWFYRLSIWGDFSEVPIRLKRRIPQERRMNKSVLRTGFTVDAAGHGDFYGFVLDGDHLYVDGNFIVHHNSGKTPVVATMCREAVGLWQGRVLILAHVKELLEQARDKLNAICPEIRAGVYSAGLGQRDTEHPVIIAGIQSVYRRARELGHFDLCLVDECHLLPPDGEGMYRSFLADLQEANPQLRVVGLTATPYRMTSGMICGPDNILQKVCFEIGVKELIRDGYLCPLVSKAGRNKADVSTLHVRAGEYKADEVEAMMDADDVVRSAVAEIVEHTEDRNACLIFASGVAHAKHIVQVFRSRHGIECGFVSGDTPAQERAEILSRIRGEEVSRNLFENKSPLKYLVNVNVLTTGFDAPNIDCVALLRPTMSPGLYYQMCLDMDTEVLTPKGWLRCHEINKGDDVAAYDLETSHVEWTPAKNKVHRRLAPGETMLGVQSPHLDIRVTDQHTMVYRSRSKSTLRWQTATADRLSRQKDSYYIPIAGENDAPGLPLSDDEIRFIGWTLTDGHLNPANTTIVISQSSASPFNAEIERMLKGCGLGYSVYRQKRTGELAKYPDALTYVIPYGQPRGRKRHLKGWAHLSDYLWGGIPSALEDISQRQLAILLEAMNQADGSKRKSIGWTQRTYQIAIGEHSYLADGLQSLLIRRGYRCNISIQKQKGEWHSGEPKSLKILRVREQTRATVGGSNHRANRLIKNRCKIQPVEFFPDEHVWCLTTQHGTLVTRRNGKVAILGNCGRGFRLHPEKQNCLVLDFGDNVRRHGPVDQIRAGWTPSFGSGGDAPGKECPECRSVIAAGYSACPDCGYEFPREERDSTHSAKASTDPVISGEVVVTEHTVNDTTWSVHTKRGADDSHPKTMRVDYRVGFYRSVSEWVCFEHTGWARQKAESWWRQRSDAPVPRTSAEAVELARAGALADTMQVTVRSESGEEYDRIIGYELGDKPDAEDAIERLAIRDEAFGEEDEWGEPVYAGIDPDEVPF